jgi:hypothetical protein
VEKFFSSIKIESFFTHVRLLELFSFSLSLSFLDIYIFCSVSLFEDEHRDVLKNFEEKTNFKLSLDGVEVATL